MSELPLDIQSKQNLFAVLETPHEIPYHSRPFMWTREHYIQHLVTKAIHKFRSGHQHWLGLIIINCCGSMPAITDAQHRVTIYFMMYLACCRILNVDENELKLISRYGFTGLRNITPCGRDAELLEEYGWKHMPNIRSVYIQDFEALGNILNDRVPTDTSTSRIYAAYDDVKALLSEHLPVEDITAFLDYIVANTKVSRMAITDTDFTLEVFDAINNIKVTVPSFYMVKNALGHRGNSERVHTAFERWRREVGGADKEFEQFVHVMSNVYVGAWNKLDQYVRAVENHLAVNPAKGFIDLADRGLAALQQLRSHRIASMVINLSSGHEIMDYCLLPLVTMADSLTTVEPFIKRLLAYALRSQNKRFTFNPLRYTEKLVGEDGVITALVEGRANVEDTIKSLDQLLLTWLDPESNFIMRVANDNYKTGAAFNKARVALLYIAEMTDKHEAVLDHALIDIDHVSPKAPRKGDPVLGNQDLLHCIGNFTPFIGKNSATLRGNRGFGNKPYTEKREAYGASNIAMTRAIARRYPVFADAEIMERSRELATQLDRLTRKELGLPVTQ